MLTSFLLFLAAAACSAAADIIKSFENSIFVHIKSQKRYEWFRSDWTQKYVNKDPANGLKRFLGVRYPAFMYDGWHFFKGCMLILLILAVLFYKGSTLPIFMLLLGAIISWGIVFELFYGLILRRKFYRKEYIKLFWRW